MRNILSSDVAVISDMNYNINNNIVISVDVMGGEHAPDAVMEAVANTICSNDNIYFLLCGDSQKISKLALKFELPKKKYQIEHASMVIRDTDGAMDALRHGKESSMRKSIDAVHDGRANACVSSGNTAALMVLSKTALGMLNGVKRPAIITRIPTVTNKTVMLDLGANVECNELVMFQFALMGACYAQSIFGVENPSIGLLNIGSEKEKGRSLEKKTYQIIEESGLNFIGCIEGNKIYSGYVNVVVADGFCGNVALKVSEGAFHTMMQLVKDTLPKWSLIGKIGAWLAKSQLKKHLAHVAPESNNGAMFIGLDGIVIKSHGNSNVKAIENALLVASLLARNKVNEKIIKSLKDFELKGIGLGVIDSLIDKIKHPSRIFNSTQ